MAFLSISPTFHRTPPGAFQEMVQGHWVAPSTAAGALRHMAGVLALLHELTHLEDKKNGPAFVERWNGGTLGPTMWGPQDS